jgi:hypothetical protein
LLLQPSPLRSQSQFADPGISSVGLRSNKVSIYELAQGPVEGLIGDLQTPGRLPNRRRVVANTIKSAVMRASQSMSGEDPIGFLHQRAEREVHPLKAAVQFCVGHT